MANLPIKSVGMFVATVGPDGSVVFYNIHSLARVVHSKCNLTEVRKYRAVAIVGILPGQINTNRSIR